MTTTPPLALRVDTTYDHAHGRGVVVFGVGDQTIYLSGHDAGRVGKALVDAGGSAQWITAIAEVLQTAEMPAADHEVVMAAFIAAQTALVGAQRQEKRVDDGRHE